MNRKKISACFPLRFASIYHDGNSASGRHFPVIGDEPQVDRLAQLQRALLEENGTRQQSGGAFQPRVSRFLRLSRRLLQRANESRQLSRRLQLRVSEYPGLTSEFQPLIRYFHRL